MRVAIVDSLPSTATASMQRDIMAAELETLSGAVCRFGAAAGVEIPVHAFIYHSLLPQEQAAR
jgi:ketopantoate reductase